MTTGSSSFNRVAFVKDGWPYYDYGQKTWTGGDTPSSSRPKDKVVKRYKYFVTEVVNGHKVPVPKEILRTRLVPSRSRPLPPHDYTCAGKEFNQDWYEVSWSGGTQHQVLSLINELPHLSAWTPNDDIKLLSKLRNDIAGSDFNAAVTSAESIKTLTMISEHSKRLYLTLSNFRKGNFRRAADELFGGRRSLKKPSSTASSNWLAMKYGWLPLLNDVSNGAQFLAYTFNSPRVFRVVTQRSLGEKGDSSYDFPYWGLNGGSYVMAHMERKESKRIVALLTEVNVPALAGLEDPASVAWELVPYSFVIDWFIPIGNWLSARGLAQSLTGTFITSYVHKERLSYLWIKNQGSVSYSFSRRLSRGAWSSWNFSRTVSTSLDVPTRPIVKPLGSLLSWDKAVTSVALLTNLKR